jgi:lipid II:glycine glycyltransferase (peptidoglycan interpeptide bridge formation enzyme)
MLLVKRVPYSEFDAFALPHPKGNFLQTSMMGRLREAMGWDVHPLLVFKDDTPVGAVLLAGKKQRYEVTMGPLFDFSQQEAARELLDALCAYAKSKGAAILEVYPYELYQTRDSSGKVLENHAGGKIVEVFTQLGWRHKGYTLDYDMTANRWLFVKDLSGIKNEADLLASYRQTTRQTIRKLEAADYTVKKMDLESLKVVKHLIDSSNEKNGVPHRPLEYYERLHAAFGDSIEFLVVYYQQKIPIAAGIFIRHPNEMVYFMSGADTMYRHLYGGHFLQHYVMQQCVVDGIGRYNFYGVSGHFESNPLLVYKAGFRGKVEEYIGGFSKVLSKRRALLMKAKRVAGKVR